MSAFAQAIAKVAEKPSGAHRIKPTAEIVGDFLVVKIPTAEIDKSKPSATKTKVDEKTGETKESGGGLGFMLEKASFRVGEATYSINAGWVGLRAEK